MSSSDSMASSSSSDGVAVCSCRRLPWSGDGTLKSSPLRPAAKPVCRETLGKKVRGYSNSRPRCSGNPETKSEKRKTKIAAQRCVWLFAFFSFFDFRFSLQRSSTQSPQCIEVHLVQRIDDEFAFF